MADADPPDLGAYTTRAGAAAIGARLRRLSERIDRDAGRLYAEIGVDFEQRWFGVLNLLSLFGPLSVGELAAALEVSHVAVSQVRQALTAAGLISWEADARDGRRRALRLTDQGQALVERLAPLWRALAEAAVELDQEAEAALAALERLERALARRSLLDRARDRLAPRP
ncbi:transcriptional regulator [Caulobacter sp. AP07]|uniref:MarR family winged helix-turn-helix transcriptional regulator n=1 Tax=Caulobacter sp. AP07 TaxID=1144304 RepID=UPI000271FCB4|nr:MarR family transcriptional regulator [Caulobacter sp. AP07]EJL30380.1 transcriptional regulator [Caulobacter sp. AP07]